MSNAPVYDVIIIGSGPGGYVAASRAGALGLKTALVEKDAALGGTCLHRGCIPTKALLHAADLVSEIKEGNKVGVLAEGVRVDWERLQKHKSQVVSMNATGVSGIMKRRKVDVYKGFGRLDGARTVVVKADDGSETRLSTKNVVLAVGSKPRALPFAPFDGVRVMSSDHILNIDHIPGSLCIIGGGVIGIEFASLFCRLGTKVTVLEMMPRILAPADADCSAELDRELKRQGCDIKTSVKVVGVEKNDQEVHTSFTDAAGNTHTVSAEHLLVAVGRPALTDGIGLETTNAKLDRGFIVVDKFMESEEAGVYAIGDCVNTPWLAHIASAEGIIAVEKIAGLKPAPLNYDHTPSCVYSEPPVAWSGLTEDEARKRGHDVKIGRFDFSHNAKAAILGKRRGFVKFVTDAKHGEILGVHIIGPQATDLLAEPAFAMHMETTIEDVATAVHAHPTLYEAIYEAAAAAADRPIHG